MEREYSGGQKEILSVLTQKGFTPEQVDFLLNVGFVQGPEDIQCVLMEEITGSGFTPKEARRIFQLLGPKNIRKFRNNSSHS